MQNIIDLSIIIVNYNTADLTIQCLSSLIEAKREEDRWEIILVDNGSVDKSKEILSAYISGNKNLKKITSFLISTDNVGFSAGNNLGIKKAQGSCVLLLNSDTEVPPNSIQIVQSELLKNPKAGAATCKLLLPDGKMDPACHRGFPTPWAAVTYFLGLEKLFPHSKLFSQYHLGFLDITISHEIDAPSGAFFMVKRDVLTKVGLLDETYFMYGEDLDWAYRIRQAGFIILFVPEVTVLHKKKQSGRESQNALVKKKTTISFYQTMQLFYKNHYQHRYPLYMTWGITRLLDLRIMIATMKG